ncbi:S-methyl-5'-thioadenosine phosphorylase [Desulfobotulus sp. H1]|uniref:S-methyl-5'-thioadenosine phosphorylase n=1 Tax=Desulfobotulus pelophilus TaxID=2823377 RepID=A0ABT3N7V2_9BACT|nr:S-methyl-5'-thioadenosine phosphorylase [Desulfobotulus pelophilus]MCW7753535.1 S-methyl-5'-thioadenosine phosphorylase [Desulfobotulus pelophilus]
MTITGIIGGSGLDNPEILESPKDLRLDTPYGPPSSPLRRGRIQGQEVILLARHGREHTIPPSGINNRANLYALKAAGCTKIIATAACGSLQEDLEPGSLVLPDQLIDFTRHRIVTFHETFEPGIENARHAHMAEPFSPQIRNILKKTAEEEGLTLHDGATLITIEGPRFSTRAESRMFRIWGADLVNMTVAPEAILATELGIPYAVVAMVTDYDSWKDDAPPLIVEEIIQIFKGNVAKLVSLLTRSLPRLHGA